MSDGDDARTIRDVAEVIAIRRVVVWLVARELRRSGDDRAALSRLWTELHRLFDSVKLPEGDPANIALGAVSAAIDDLLEDVMDGLGAGDEFPGRVP